MSVVKFPKKDDVDIEGLRLGPEQAAAIAKAKAVQEGPQKARGKDFVYEDLARLALGLNAVGKVWVYLLQQRRMKPDAKVISVGSARLARLGVGRGGKRHALRQLEQVGLIRVEWGVGRNPRIRVLV
jgi:hypothetical protein